MLIAMRPSGKKAISRVSRFSLPSAVSSGILGASLVAMSPEHLATPVVLSSLIRFNMDALVWSVRKDSCPAFHELLQLLLALCG